MLFDETYEEYMALYTEGNETAKKVAKVAGKVVKGTAKLAGKAAKEVAHFATDDQFRSKRKKVEDNETAKKVAKVAGKAAKGTAKLAGKSALAFADYMTGGDVSKGIDFVKSSYEDGEDSDSNEEDAERVDKDRMK
jgi:hypothetical protein